MPRGRNNNPGGPKPAPQRSPSPRPSSPEPPQPPTESTAPRGGSPRPTISTAVQQTNTGSVGFRTWAQMLQESMREQGQGRGTGGTGGGQLPPASPRSGWNQPRGGFRGGGNQGAQRGGGSGGGHSGGAGQWQPRFPAGVERSATRSITGPAQWIQKDPGENRPISRSVHNQAIYGQDPGGNYPRVRGGHVWRGDVGQRPADLWPRFRGGQHADPPPGGGHYFQNGVYKHPNPRIEVERGNSTELIDKPLPHTMFPRGLTPAQVKQLAEEAWNGGRPFYGYYTEADGRVAWEGIASLPDGSPILISGHVSKATNPVDRSVLHYYPSEEQ